MTTHLVDLLASQTKHVYMYAFLYNQLNHILVNKNSVGNTRVRFVSRKLRHKFLKQFRHVYLEFQIPSSSSTRANRYQTYMAEHTPYEDQRLLDSDEGDWMDEYCIQLPNVPYDVDQIKTREDELSDVYLPGLYDCRHYTYDLLNMCYSINE
jgi:hypothetical protein